MKLSYIPDEERCHLISDQRSIGFEIIETGYGYDILYDTEIGIANKESIQLVVDHLQCFYGIMSTLGIKQAKSGFYEVYDTNLIWLEVTKEQMDKITE